MTTPLRVYTELPTGILIHRVLVWQPIGLLLTAAHVLLVRESVWLYPVVPLVLAWLYSNAPLTGALVFFQFLIYQNIIISLFSPGMDYMPAYVMLEGSNFATLCILSIIALNRLTTPYWWGQLRRMTWWLLAAMGMVTFYSLIGASKAGPTSALIYFREFGALLLAILVGLDLGRVWGFKTVGLAFIFSAVLAICLGIVEYLVPLDFYAWTNEVSYFQLKYAMQPEGNKFYVPEDIVKHFSNVFFNISGLSPTVSAIKTQRFGGSILTMTSFAYVLSVVGVVAVSLRRSAWLLVILPLMYLEGAKGASFLLILTLLLWGVWELTRNKRMLVASGVLLACTYVGAGLVIGLGNNDYHMVGFMGGVHSLVSNPLGHGIGVGGNLSSTANAGFKIDGPGGFTRLGADFALESAVGVLFYQTGIASLLIFAVFITTLRNSPLGKQHGHRLLPMRQDILPIAAAMIAVNGVFQEEAYSPYAAGMIMLLCSCIISNGRRPASLYSPVTTYSPAMAGLRP
jgi:hypothetical protein